LFEPNDTATRFLIQERIRETVTRWEPRVRVDSVTVEPQPQDPEAVLATLVFRMVATGRLERLTVSVSLGVT
jgi:phage baseplate assembly protein W